MNVQRYGWELVKERETCEPGYEWQLRPAKDGEWLQYGEHADAVSSLESQLALYREALKATVAWMKDDSGGYEVYRAVLDSAEAALADSPTEGEK